MKKKHAHIGVENLLYLCMLYRQYFYISSHHFICSIVKLGWIVTIYNIPVNH